MDNPQQRDLSLLPVTRHEKNKDATEPRYRWHVIYVKHKAEKKILKILMNKGVNCFLPCRISKRIWSDRIKMIEEPLLPGYIFINISHLEYYDVLVVPGVIKYVCFDNKPALIADVQIESLKIFVSEVNSKLEIMSDRIAKGALVKITRGQLKNVVGEVVEIRNKRNLLLRFNTLGYNVYVDLEQNEIEVLERIA